MKVTRSHQGRVTILAVQGPMIEDDLQDLDNQIDACLNEGQFRIVFDMRQAPFVDSAGLEKIQSLVFDLGRRGGDLRLASLNNVCQDIFMVTRMESFVQVFDDRESAIRSLL